MGSATRAATAFTQPSLALVGGDLSKRTRTPARTTAIVAVASLLFQTTAACYRATPPVPVSPSMSGSIAAVRLRDGTRVEFDGLAQLVAPSSLCGLLHGVENCIR